MAARVVPLALALALVAGPAEGSREAQRLRRQAAEAEAAIARLTEDLTFAADRRAAAEADAAEAERRLGAAALAEVGAAQAKAALRARRAAALAALSLADRGARAPARRDAPVLAAMARAAAAEQARRAADLAAAAAAKDATLNDRARLAEAERRLAAERMRITALIAERETVRRSLARAAEAADRRARAAAARARTLADLARETASRRSAAVDAAAGRRAPAQGETMLRFGARDAAGRAAEGLALATRPGAQVVAPINGHIAYAGPFRSFGRVLILQAEQDYVLILAGLHAAYARPGDRVRVGEPLGEMAQTGASSPSLYFEVRRRGRPIDPGLWLAGRT